MFAHLDFILLGGWHWYSEVQPLWNGSVGVYIFFVISGYLISGALIPDLATGETKSVLLRFWVRRFARIVPMALVWIAVPLALSVVFNSRGMYQSLSVSFPAAMAALFFAFNAYISAGFPPAIYGPYWSLSLEEQFYLLFPLILLVLPSRTARLMALPASIWLITLIPPQFGPFRADGLIFGVALYMLTSGMPSTEGKPVPIIVGWLVTMSLLAGMIVWPSVRSHLRLGDVLQQGFAIGSFVLVYLATLRRGFILPLGLWGNKAFDWIGTRSFGIYLIHVPAYITASEITWRLQRFDTPLERLAIAVSILFIFTELSHRYIESPARRWGRSFDFAPRPLSSDRN